MTEIMTTIMEQAWFVPGIIGAITFILGAIGAPQWLQKIINDVTPIVVRSVAQTMKDKTNEAKKDAAIEKVKEKIPVPLRVLPSMKKRIDDAIEASVNINKDLARGKE